MTHNEYASKRVGFAILNGNVLFQKDDNYVYSKQWLCEQRGYTEEEYEKIVRGGLFADRITISVGSNYESADLSSITAENLIEIVKRWRETYGKDTPVTIYNGQIPGEIGEDWKPREVITL